LRVGVETALFCVCLDDTTPRDTQQPCALLLHGDGGPNRWYDKSLSLIVFPDGRAGLNVEHCELDGTTVTDFLDAALGGPPADPPATAAPAPPPAVPGSPASDWPAAHLPGQETGTPAAPHEDLTHAGGAVPDPPHRGRCGAEPVVANRAR
jgi:Choline/Carnitine o-acyltransferase